MVTRRGWVDAVEAAYRLDLSLDEWTRCIAGAVAPSWDRGFGVLCYLFDVSEGHFNLRHVGLSGIPAGMAKPLITSLEATPPEIYVPMLLNPRPYGPLSKMPGMEEMLSAMEAAAGHAGVRDSNGLVARSDWRRGMVLGANSPEREELSTTGLRRLASIAAHLEAGLRLRETLSGEPSLEDTQVEAILDTELNVVHAKGPAAAESARRELREAARRMDRARGALRRRDENESLALWHGLVQGRWSLVDHFDVDGRRFIVARENRPGIHDPRNLTGREAQVAHQVGLGKTNAEVAYALGLADSTVRNHLARAMAKLGLSRRVELVREASAPIRESLISLGGEKLVIRSTQATLARFEAITDAEADVLRLVVDGLSNREIAAKRKAAERTVANQVAALFRKLGAGTREELVRIAVQRGE